MTSAAWLLVWLALAAGALQVLICGVLLFSSGWAIPVVLLFAVLPVVPLILMQEIRGWRRLNPVVPAAAAILSIAVSGGFYWELFTKMAR
jgi:ABC-type nickel/cobalt efflux system permease component RcnA